MTEILNKVRLALRIVTHDFDEEITDLISACLLDLDVAGVTNDDRTDPLIIRAVITYCKMNFGDVNDDYERLKASYDEQKAQLGMTSGYTDWLGVQR